MDYSTLDFEYKNVVYDWYTVRNGEAVGRTAPTEGDFHQTENEYCVYVYHRPFGGRYDHLVGYAKVRYKI